MARLIDADALMQEIEKSMNQNPHSDSKVKINHENEHKHFMWLLAKQPTAYNVERVVEQINGIEVMLPIGDISADNIKFTNNILRLVKAGAIERIRKGGVDG